MGLFEGQCKLKMTAPTQKRMKMGTGWGLLEQKGTTAYADGPAILSCQP